MQGLIVLNMTSGYTQKVLLKDTRVLGRTMLIPLFGLIIKSPRSYSKHIRFDRFLTYRYLWFGSTSHLWKVFIPPSCLFDAEIQQRTI